MVYVFKTSVDTSEAVNQIYPYLDSVLPGSAWNFDLDDCDNILRIKSETEVMIVVCQLLTAKGFECHELSD